MKKPGYLIFTGLRRRLISLLLGGPRKTVSCLTSETIAIPSKVLIKYSDASILSIYDPRSMEIQVHGFNSRSVREVQNVIVEPAQALVYDQLGRLIVESTCWPTSQLTLSFPWKPRKGRYQELKQGLSLSSASYYHWLIEDLPTVLSSLRESPSLPLILLENAPSYCIDFAKAIGRDVITVEGPTFVRNLVLTEKREDVGWPHPKDIEELEKFMAGLAQTSQPSSRNIYISRKFSKRSPSNETQVESLFVEFGFEVVFTEQLSFLAQVDVFQNAILIAGIHGAGLSNMVWAREGAVILDIANLNYWTECFHRLAHIKGHKYEHFLYDGPVENSIDIQTLEQKLVSLDLSRRAETK